MMNQLENMMNRVKHHKIFWFWTTIFIFHFQRLLFVRSSRLSVWTRTRAMYCLRSFSAVSRVLLRCQNSTGSPCFAPYDLATCPSPGWLWTARRSWIFYRHPWSTPQVCYNQNHYFNLHIYLSTRFICHTSAFCYRCTIITKQGEARLLWYL